MSLRDLLSQRTEDVKAPPPLPEGNYHITITGFAYGKSRVKGTDYVRFSGKLVGHDPDVEDADLEGIKWEDKEVHKDFYVTDDAVHILADFLRNVLGSAAAGRSLEESLPQVKGMTLKGYISQTMDAKSGRVFSNLDSLKPMDE